MESFNTFDIINNLNEINEDIEELTDFFKTYTIESLHKKKKEAYEASVLCHTKKMENPTKYKIVQLFNKLQKENINYIADELMKINIKSLEEFNTMFQRVYTGLQNNNILFRKCMGDFCFAIKNYTFQITEGFDTNTEIVFGPFLLSKIKEKYTLSIDFKSIDYNLNFGKQIMLIISTLYNSRLLNDVILNTILTDYINLLNTEPISENNIINNALLQLNVLIENIENKNIIENIKLFLINYLKTNENSLDIQTFLTCEITLTKK
jgi:hypothetical protein